MIIKKNIWYFTNHALHEGRNNSLDWSGFHFERIDNKHDRNAFRKSAKRFLLSSIRQTQYLVEKPSPGTLVNQGTCLRRLIHWMISQKIYRFNFLKEYDLIEFINFRIKTNSENALNAKTLRTYIRLFESLWDLRFRYPSALAVDPYQIEKLQLLSKSSKPKFIWNAVPLELALPLIKDALVWLENEAEDLLVLIALYNRLRGNLNGLTKKQMYDRCNSSYAFISESSDEYISLRQRLAMSNLKHKDVFRIAFCLSLGAVITVILFFSGIRASELLSLKIGCCRQRQHVDGHQYWYIKGIAAKKGGVVKEWVVPDPVVKAVQFVEQLHALLLPRSNHSYLFELPSSYAILPYPYIKVQRYWSSDVAHMLRFFARSVIRDEPISPNIRLHSHQARKTFARFVVLRDKRGLEALAQHYGHIYTAILDRAYVGSDFELHHLIDEESQKDLEEGLTDLLSNKSLGGNAGDKLAKIREKANISFRGKSVLKSVVRMLMKEGVTLAPCDWGYCVYIKDLSACRGDESGPNPVLREPNTCSTCNNFAVTSKHKYWWEDRVKREESFLKQPNLSAQTITVVNNRLDRSKEILKALNPSLLELKAIKK
jgi:integrase